MRAQGRLSPARGAGYLPLLLSIPVAAQPPDSARPPVDDFGTVNAHYYRGKRFVYAYHPEP